MRNPARRPELDWGRRFNIIQCVARGLLYLHHDSYLKVSNILLDENMNPKISDFLLALIVQGTQHLTNTQKVVGTLVLILAIISGRNNTSFYYFEKHLGVLAYFEFWSLKCLSQHVCDLLICHAYLSSTSFFAEVMLDDDMLCPAVEHWILRHCYSRLVVTKTLKSWSLMYVPVEASAFHLLRVYTPAM
ncbi:S-locus lectin protein kinase family protein [Prunus dulcis]|uniref:non-specific serine/threonine protein kinase n=1 Tax=Prunus dulcis TaxID=3755 RepID=A0A5H2XTD0_PRUDU|nr:S-locus lectin protein kinase family protein [Prunus dulcis]